MLTPVRMGLCVIVLLGAAVPAWGETVRIYAAGSLAKVVETLAAQAGPAANVEVETTFGPAGKLRARIEAGETPDLFLSADLAAPRKLEADGRTVVPTLAFAENRMCLIAPRVLGVTADHLIEALSAPGARLKTSTPGEDPGGDYAVTIFDRIDARRPGTGAILRKEAQVTAEATKSARPLDGRSASSSLFLAGRIDLLITYCSSAPTLQHEDPDLDVIPFPTALDPHPINGMAVLSTKPGALRLALFLMSDKGQAVVSAAGLIPIAKPQP